MSHLPWSPAPHETTTTSSTPPRRRFPVRRRLGTQRLDTFCASGRGGVREVAGVEVRIEIGIGQLGADGQPARTNIRVPTEQVQSPPPQAKVLYNVKDFDGLLQAPELFLRDDQVNVHVCMNEVAVRRSSHRAFDPDQAVVLRPLEHRLGLENLGVARILYVRADPANILASTESPLPEAIPAHVQTLRAAAPEKHETAVRRQLSNVQCKNLVPGHELALRIARRGTTACVILLQRRLNQDNVELCAERAGRQLLLLQIRVQVHRGRGALLDQVVLQLDEFAQLRVLHEPVG